MTIRHDGLLVDWLGYATTRIEAPDGTVVYLDPGRYGVLSGEWTPPGEEAPPHPAPQDDYPKDGDLVCVTHDHHYDTDAIQRVAKQEATVVVYEGVDAANIDRDVTPVDELPYEVVRVTGEDHLSAAGVECWSVPAYNDPDGPRAGPDGSVTHPPGFGCGFLLSVADVTVFWPGDSDALDGFAELDVSLFLANIGGTVVSDRREAAALAERMDPDLVLPVHYNTIDILTTDSGAFGADVAGRGVPVVLDEN
ncbi:MBL fold metallo-hydrolase [Haloarchaeobius iranensis]|uniref:L-ascorbate metabolism protein UlaG, beta-lactamase superfamily n=1 Tax=Haloarchaeobius iranensis TaxID=996166 RepID=A0A1G9W5K2_9EURY|nr:MBL fold metallo-hydrolase [Haloarchaeobius iranensis]SDM79798.1 L-ascorbate metabolism protein UlaG, beta-lactamase superfamily [Haloarchaeobius iranensis]